MKNEVIDLLKNKEKLSNKTINEGEFAQLVKEIGKQETSYIKADKITKNLTTQYIGKNLYIYNEVSSTNTIAKFLSENDIENGSVVISEKQNRGKGRSGKFWESPLGGIWLSIILNQGVNYTKLPIITLATGVAVAKSIKKIGIENPEIKWPNDIMINDKKVCGILTETVSKLNKIETVIIGVGIDANIDTCQLPEELQNTTTTIKEELQKSIDENHLIKIFFEEFEEIMGIFNQNRYEEILKEWRNRSYSIGKIVEVRKPFNNSYDAYVLGISKEGALVVEKNDGSIEKVFSGECVIKK